MVAATDGQRNVDAEDIVIITLAMEAQVENRENYTMLDTLSTVIHTAICLCLLSGITSYG